MVLNYPIARSWASMANFAPPNSGHWTTGLCGCFEDCSSCWCGMCCPCIVIGRYAEILDQGSTTCCTAGAVYFLIQLLTGCGFLYTCGYRARLRQKFGLPEEPCGDCMTDCCCPACSILQVYRELGNRNINPKLGYDGVRHIYDQPPQAPGQMYMEK